MLQKGSISLVQYWIVGAINCTFNYNFCHTNAFSPKGVKSNVLFMDAVIRRLDIELGLGKTFYFANDCVKNPVCGSR